MTLRVGGKDVNLEHTVSKAGILDSSQVDVAIKLKNTKFTAVCRDPELKKEFDVEPLTSLNKIKDDILVDLKARSLQVKQFSLCIEVG